MEEKNLQNNNTLPHTPVITVDGPSGVGKGTLSQLLAQRLGWKLLDSGAIYRVLSLATAHHVVSLDNEEAISLLATHLDVQFLTNQNNQGIKVILEGEDVTAAIRTQDCAERASKIAVFPRVREALLRRQRAFNQPPGLIADGRDMGTVVFPNAIAKLYLTASAEERAKRRYIQLQGKGGDVKINCLLSEINQRDERDMKRTVAPLIAAQDALSIDTTSMNIDQVLDIALEYVVNQLSSVNFKEH